MTVQDMFLVMAMLEAPRLRPMSVPTVQSAIFGADRAPLLAVKIVKFTEDACTIAKLFRPEGYLIAEFTRITFSRFIRLETTSCLYSPACQYADSKWRQATRATYLPRLCSQRVLRNGSCCRTIKNDKTTRLGLRHLSTTKS